MISQIDSRHATVSPLHEKSSPPALSLSFNLSSPRQPSRSQSISSAATQDTTMSAASTQATSTSPLEVAENAYFSSNPPPKALSAHSSLAKEFINYHAAAHRRVVLVTSGGTTVPLEKQTVRFIDNFSAGTRGATSAEYFLEAGYAVIFLHRQFSLLPYSRHYSHSTDCFLDFMHEADDGSVVVNPAHQEKMITVLREYNIAKQNRMLLMLPFVTITDYLHELRAVAQLMRPLGPDGLLYLAAAVSDFFVPPDRMSEHKIQSTNATDHFKQGPTTITTEERQSPHTAAAASALAVCSQNPGSAVNPDPIVARLAHDYQTDGNFRQILQHVAGNQASQRELDLFHSRFDQIQRELEDESAVDAEDTEEETFDNFDSSPSVPRSKRLIIDLDPVPKFLKSLVDGWAPEGMIVSFKLETDPEILVHKAKYSLDRYQHHLVIGNLLTTRKWEVVFVAPNQPDRWIRVPSHRRTKTFGGNEGLIGAADKSWVQEKPMDPNMLPQGEPEVEIESLIIPALKEMHSKHIETIRAKSK